MSPFVALKNQYRVIFQFCDYIISAICFFVHSVVSKALGSIYKCRETDSRITTADNKIEHLVNRSLLE